LRREQSKGASTTSPREQLPSSKIIRSADLSPLIAEARELGQGAFGAVFNDQ